MSRVVFGPFQPKVGDSVFASGKKYCKELYWCIKEELPPIMPDPLVKSSHTTYFVVANHAVNVVTQRLHLGVLIYVMNAPIIWLSNNHNTFEISKFGSELVSIRIVRDIIIVLC